MTPTQLIDNLKLPQDQVDRIKALKASFDEFENILNGGNPEHGADTPFRQGILGQAESCVNLIAQILGESPNTVLQALLALFGLTELEFTRSSTSDNLIVALSALVAAQQN
ncbi:MAG: hypothetical protein ABSG03_10385 [Bryobacteraceae bacterium]|jgi:hypothetical protein